MKTLLLILLLATVVQAQSIKDGTQIADWVLIGESSTASVYYAPASVARGNGKVKVWIKLDFPFGSAAASSEPLSAGKNFGSIRAYGIFDCDQSLARSGSSLVLYYDRDGKLIKSRKEKETVTDKKGTGLFAIFAYFCEREPPPILRGPPTLKPNP